MVETVSVASRSTADFLICGVQLVTILNSTDRVHPRGVSWYGVDLQVHVSRDTETNNTQSLSRAVHLK